MSARAKPRTDLENLVFRRVGQAIGDHGLIAAGDRIAVAVRGDLQSLILLHTLDLHRRRSPFSFDLEPIFVDGATEETDLVGLTARIGVMGYALRVRSGDFSGAVPAARARRRALAEACAARGLNKLACPDHLDDFLRALLGNLFHHGRLATLAVHLAARGQRPVVIRPLVYVEAEHLRRFAAERGFVALTAAQSVNEGPLDALVQNFAARYPRVRRSMLAALKHARPSHLLDSGLISI